MPSGRGPGAIKKYLVRVTPKFYLLIGNGLKGVGGYAVILGLVSLFLFHGKGRPVRVSKNLGPDSCQVKAMFVDIHVFFFWRHDLNHVNVFYRVSITVNPLSDTCCWLR